MRFLVLFLMILGSGSVGVAEEVSYRCQVIGLAGAGAEVEDEWVIHEEFFVGSKSDGSHGGFVRSFENELQTLIVSADAVWLTLAWWVHGELIAEVVNVQTNPETDHRVLLAFHPKIESFQASLDCLRL